MEKLFVEVYVDHLRKIDDEKIKKLILSRTPEMLSCKSQDDIDSFFNKYNMSINERVLIMDFFNDVGYEMLEDKKSSTIC